MRKSIVALLAVALVSSVAAADVNAVGEFVANRDAGVCGAYGSTWSEALCSQGAEASVRLAKYRQHSLLMDWDMDAVQAFIDANIEPGYTAKARLRLTRVDTSVIDGCAIKVSMVAQAGMDWEEGDGIGSYPEFNWSDGTQAVTSYAPKTNKDGTFSDDRWMWGNTPDAGMFWNYRNNTLTNSLNFLFFPGTDELYVDLDDAILDSLLNDPQNVGLYTYETGFNTNYHVYTREAGDAVAPMLEISFVPEPATMSLLAFGAVALIRRKK